MATTLIDHQELGSTTWDNGSTDKTIWQKGSIPNTYDHLLVIGSIRSTASAYWQNLWIRVGNGGLSTGAYYSSTYLSNVNSSSAISGRASGQTKWAYQYVQADWGHADCFSVVKIWIPNYAVSNNGEKQVIIQTVVVNNSNTAAQGGITMTAGLWNSQSAITDIGVSEPNSGFKAYTDFSLYGISQ
jgi:hypothetical protein